MHMLQAVFNHLTLPPEVPAAQDTDIDAVSHNVLGRMINACEFAAENAQGTTWQQPYRQLHECLQDCRELNIGRLERSTLLKHFQNLQPDRPLILYVNEQNACLLIRQNEEGGEKYVTFESFETSPAAEKVLATGHALEWDFPGRCAQIPLAEFASKPFQECLASFLEHASMESLDILQASSKKAGIFVEEVRDTTDPALITHMLMAIIEAMGGPVPPRVLRKKVRDDVNFGEGNIPWRRLPFWLVLRVTAQRHLCLALGIEQGRLCYKALIAIVLAQLLGDTSGRLSPHLTDRLRRKLVRRMAKMETDRQKLEKVGFATSQPWLDKVSSTVRNAVEAEMASVESAWTEFKQNTARSVEPLPVRARGEALVLTLPNSRTYLESLLNYKAPYNKQLGPMSLPYPLDLGVQKAQAFTDKIHSLAAMEQAVERQAGYTIDAAGNHEASCFRLAQRINEIMTEMRPAYESHSEQMSAMILCVFTLWIDLDKCATAACPLLLKHRPAFQPELLDVLQLPTREAMVRLQEIQIYLANRHAKSQYGSILDAASNTCFAVNYCGQTNDMQRLASRIQGSSDNAAEETRARMRAVHQQYERLTQEIGSYDCGCVTTIDGRLRTKGCRKCPRIWKRNGLKVKTHEAYLPKDNTSRFFLVFELAIPGFISAYRDATWRIISELAHPSRPEIIRTPVVHLRNCDALQPFMTASVDSLSLASTVKCFSQTHYRLRKNGGAVDSKRIILPFAAKFRLFDHKAQIWVDDLRLPLTLEHTCGVHTPHRLLSILPASVHPPTNLDGPSSYEIQANQSECPNKMSVHEFSALQKLMLGKRVRWLNILMELTSSNVNISNEDTMMVLNQLAVQAGPALPGEPLRAIHEIFKDRVFTTKLLGVVQTLIGEIKTNWREHNCMELIITLLLRLLSLSPESQAVSFLQIAREALLKWIDNLRHEVRNTTDASAAQRFSTYGLHAALLCRRTFSTFVNSKETLNDKDLLAWVQCSLALQENILHDTNKLSQNLRGMLIRDAKMSFCLQDRIKDSMKSFRSVVGAEISKSWHGEPESTAASLSSWTFLPGHNERWIVATTPEPYPQRVHFNFIEGHLLVDGKPREKLPTAIMEDRYVKEVFGDQHLLTYPSYLPGMSHRLAQSVVRGPHIDVHFGLRDGYAVIRTSQFNPDTWMREVREFIPRHVFTSNDSFDLPDELVSNCAHWINLSTMCLEIRRAVPGSRNFWITRDRDWIIDLKTRRATRGNSNLVDPHCNLSIRIAKVFRFFEERNKLTVYQPQYGKLSVALKHMDLLFEVNENGQLDCRELNARIDLDQDIGSWYGLRSKLVLRSMRTRSRSVLVPLGTPRIVRNGLHVDVYVANATDYGSFAVDSILGRLSCKPEPRLIYSKALFHAVTSFCIPDPLTNRTGSEEALAILQSDAAQPWTPLPASVRSLFDVFDGLAPSRAYYPPPLRRLQTVRWDANKTPTIQLDIYKPIVESIKRRSNQLGIFYGAMAMPLADPGHLCLRGIYQRCIYERSIDEEYDKNPIIQEYHPRDRVGRSMSARVYQIARVILSGGKTLCTKSTLTDILESCEVIGGFSNHGRSSYSSKPLSSWIDTPINEQWGELIGLCQGSKSTSDLLFLLGTLAFNEQADMNTIHSLAAFGVIDGLKHMRPPQYSCFTNIQSRDRPPVHILQALISPAYPPFVASGNRNKKRSYNSRGHSESDHIRFCEEAGRRLAEQIHALWPRTVEDVLENLDEPSTAVLHIFKGVAINTSLALEYIRPEWDRRLALRELASFMTTAQNILDHLQTVQDTEVPAQWNPARECFIGDKRAPVLRRVAESILTLPLPTLEEITAEPPLSSRGLVRPRAKKPAMEVSELSDILNVFGNTDDTVRKKYSDGLLQSLTALEIRREVDDVDAKTPTPTLERMAYMIKSMSDVVERKFTQLQSAISTQEPRSSWLRLGNLAPFTTPIELLQLLRTTMRHNVNANLKKAIVSYGKSISTLQRLSRINTALKRRDERALQDELRNPGHQNWEPLKCPDWLLLELDSDILIREEQVQVARAIIAPESRENTVLQLNMGAGKTSCVVPMAVAMLANGTNLNRLLVPKPLLMQTAQMIQTRLGGLVGRQVYSMPFSRKTSTDTKDLDLYIELHRECQARRGLVLTCHEHMLSFKLGGWQKFVDGRNATAKKMLRFQKWLDNHCRDILDECDFTLSVKTQLNYPSGAEMAVDGHPYRWQVCEQLLEVVALYLPTLRLHYPKGIELRWRPEVPREESFPIVHFLKSDAEDSVHELIIENVCRGWNPLLRPITSIYRERPMLQQVFLGERLDEGTLSLAASLFVNPLAAVKALLVIRGLLRNKILVSILNKRWNVQYGLHPNRHPVAVPFEAKGKPSEQAEFGHPDVAILLTCLSFYYTGLTLEQLCQGLSHILQSDDPAAHFERWTSTCTTVWENVPHWNTVNTDDEGQMQMVWEHLRYNRIVINDYMNHFVFPAHARQFETKLQACSWDIPLVSDNGAKTTGFSGTNDNRMMLPLTIKQHDLPDLQHTSAEVLSYMLQSRNKKYYETTNHAKVRLTERGLLEALQQEQIRVLIDAGAYILENDNKSLVKEWLRLDIQAKAAVYFGADNRAWVHFRSEAKDDVPLLATPFVADLSECLVFLDECHCRGVDLKLPVRARGALTLSLKQTKDFTIQAAMRLRQLRTTQSIAFYGPPEVSQSIKDVCRLSGNVHINSAHVVYWLLEQTCRSIEDQQMLYVTQGTDFCRRTDAIWRCKNFMSNENQRQELLNVLMQPERQTLQELYGPSSTKPSTNADNEIVSAKMRTFIGILRESEHASHNGYRANMLEEVEQEREVELQVEQVRQVQRPNKQVALKFPGIHEAITQFFLTGKLQANAFPHAFAFIANTNVGKKFGVRKTSSRLFITNEFSRTVQVGRSGSTINFLRPVEWIMWSPSSQTALVVIPEEAEYLIQQYQRIGADSKVHLITYAAPVTKAMLSSRRLGFYSRPALPRDHTFPAWFTRDVGILAGRLYVDQAEWNELAEYVDGSETNPGVNSDRIAPDPAAFLMEWLTLRRKTVDILHTPMGQICTGRRVEDSELAKEVRGEEDVVYVREDENKLG